MSIQMGNQDLGRLIRSYPGGRVRQQVGVRNCIDRTAHRKRSPARSREGAKPNIFLHWRSISAQPNIGNAILNDGLRIAIQRFITAERLRPKHNPKRNIICDRDSYKYVGRAPRFFKVLKGDRIKDHPLMLAETLGARIRA